jgi:Spy/CpxP family protein refolding chaperone
MRARLPWILFAISLVLNICVIAGFFYVTKLGGEQSEQSPGRAAVFAAGKLKLDDAQKRQLDQMRQTLRKVQQDNAAATRPLRREMLRELNVASPDMAKVDGLVDKLAEQQALTYKAAARAINDFQNVLRPEQRAEFRNLMRERAAARMLFGPGDQQPQERRQRPPPADGGKKAPSQ